MSWCLFLNTSSVESKCNYTTIISMVVVFMSWNTWSMRPPRSAYLTWVITVVISKLLMSSFFSSMSSSWLRKTSQTMCLATGGPLFTPWNVHVSLTTAPQRMFKCWHFECLHDMFACNSLFYKWAIALWPFGWQSMNGPYFGCVVDDTTNVMSSPSWYNKTLESRISRALNTIKATMPSCFLFFTYLKKLGLHTILVVSKNISNKMKNQQIHFMYSKPFFGRKKGSFHVTMEWFHSLISALPYMWNVAIANTPHYRLMCPMVFKVCNELRCIRVFGCHDVYL